MNLNESHRRHLAVSLRHAAELLEEAERILIASRSESPFRKYTSDLAPWQSSVIEDHIASIRRKLADAGREMKLNVSGYAIDARHAIHVQAAFASNDVTEMHSRYLRGYGALEPDTAQRVDAIADALENSIQELDRALSVPPGESIEARIARLSRSPVSPEILNLLDRLIAKYHIAELRRPMATLIERIEQRTLNIAVFGRVSSGKSSLLNALLGASVLPVGVTPITAVPTRIRFGDPASVRVVYRDKRDELIPIEQLADLASEVSNPGNRRRVALLQVRYPSPLLREGIEFVDTPGIGSLATAGATETFAYLPRADLAILLIDVGSAPGADELSIVSLLQIAAVPVQVVISKADLADEPSLSRMQSYVRDTLGGATGLAPAVHAVSALASHRHLVEQWIAGVVQPILDEHETKLEESIRRSVGAIRDAIVMRLQAFARHAPAHVDHSIDEEVRSVFGELRRDIQQVPREIERITDEALQRAAAPLGEDESNVRDTIIAIAQQLLDDARSTLLRRQSATRNRLRELAASAGLAPDLLQLMNPAADLQQLPLLDVAAVLPNAQARRPLLGGVKRFTRILGSAYGTPLRESVRAYGYQLRDWATHRIDRMQASFTSALDATRSNSRPANLDLASVHQDMESLASVTAKKEFV